MITPILEKAILNGNATFQTISVAFSSFMTLPIPKGQTAIITSLKWFPFVNPYQHHELPGPAPVITWRELFRYNEYQLKIESKKSLNYMQFRNEFRWRFFPDPLAAAIGIFVFPNQLDDTIDFTTLQENFLPEQGTPIIQDVFFVCEEYIKLSVTRNAFINAGADIVGLVQPVADEQPSPNGLADANVLLRLQMQSETPNTMFYFPGGIKNDGNDLLNSRKTESYRVDIDKDYSPVQDDTLGNITANFPFQTFPLIEFGYVLINNKQFDLVRNT